MTIILQTVETQAEALKLVKATLIWTEDSK